MARTTLMTEGKPLPLMLKFALPMIVGNALQMIYNVADSMVVGRMVGIDAFAAVGVAGNLNWMVFSILLGLATGFGTLLAQYYGSGDKVRFRRSITMSLLLTIIIGAAITVLSVVLTKPLLRLMDTPADIIDDAALYLQITFAFFIIVFFTNTASAILRAIGNSRLPMNIMIIAGVVNIVLNIVLVKITDWGVGAVAVATVVSEIAASAIFLYYILKIKELKVSKEDWKIDKEIIRELLRLGFPIGFRNLVIAIGGVYIQSYINAYGTNFIAGISVTKRLYSLLELVGGAMQGAAATFVAQNYGAKKFGRIKQGVREAMVTMLISSAAIMGIMFLFGRSIASLFVSGDVTQVEEVLNVASEQLYFMVGFLPFLYILLLYQTGIQSLGNSVLPTIGGVMEMVIRIATVLIFAALIGKWGVYLSEVLAWVFCAAFYVICYKKVFRKKCHENGFSSKDGVSPLKPKA